VVEIGQTAPDFSLPSHDGTTVRLPDGGGVVVVVFYNQDDTDNCTREMQEFSALLGEFTGAGARVVGISPDSVETHRAFRDKYALTVTLLADPDRVAISAYGVWGQKKLYGREYEGLIRTSFIIDRSGKIAAVMPVRRINGHAAKVLGFVTTLGT